MANLTRYEPWGLFDQFNNEINRLFSSRYPSRAGDAAVTASDWVPAVDIKEEAGQYVIHADIPGVDPNDIEVTMENGILSVKGERQRETKEEREGYKRVERSKGSFFRSFSLPDSVDGENVSASGKNGVLEIIIPKVERKQSRKINVNS